MTEDEMEVAIDVRRCGDVPLREITGDLLRACFGDAEPSRIHLEPWLATSASVIWEFNALYWKAHRIQNKAYAKSADLVWALAEAGAELLQIDELFLAGYPEDVAVAVEAINIVTQGVDVTWGLHVCYGNRYARPSWEGHYGFLFPAVLDANVDQLILEFGRKGYEDLQVIQRFGGDRVLGLGVVDVKSEQIESADLIAQRILKGLEIFPADKLIINPDCGLRHLPADVARSKLAAMVEGTAAVRRTLPHQSGHTQLAEPHDRTVTSPELTVEQGA